MPEQFIVEKTTWDELEKMGYPSVTDYCRFLVKEGKPLPGRIEVYRGEMLCFSVFDVAESAKLQPSGTSQGFVAYNPPPSKRTRKPSGGIAIAQD